MKLVFDITMLSLISEADLNHSIDVAVTNLVLPDLLAVDIPNALCNYKY